MVDGQIDIPALPIGKKLTRRQALRTLALTGVASLTGGAILTACNDPAPATINVVLYTSGWPVTPMPSSSDQNTDIYKKSFAASLQNWYANNPGVMVKAAPGNTSTPAGLKAAISANTAPTWYSDLGDSSTNRFAYSLGYAAETTDLIQQYKVDSILADYALPRWRAQWNFNGHYYSLPGDALIAGNGLFYRRDQILELGLAEPKQGWSWEDFHILAKGLTGDGPPAVGAPLYLIDYMANSNFLEDLAQVPTINAPWPYRYNYSPRLQEWIDLATLYRTMYFDDKSIAQDSASNEFTLTQDFVQGKYKMVPSTAVYFTANLPGGSVKDMPEKYGKLLDNLAGFVSYPFGSNGAFSAGTSNFDAVLLNPHLSATALNKAADLWFYMFYGSGYVDQRVMRYEMTKDPRAAYDYIAPGNRFQKNPNIPVTVEDAWGQRIVQAWMDCINIPLVPDRGLYYPPEAAVIPPAVQQRHNEALLALSTSQQDVGSILLNFTNQYSDLAATIRSSIGRNQFQTSSLQYYAALGTFWQATSPLFYQNDWLYHYNNDILPGLA